MGRDQSGRAPDGMPPVRGQDAGSRVPGARPVPGTADRAGGDELPAVKREPWQAPRTAYLLTAMAAEDDTKGPGRLWYGLGDREQLDVLRALGAQCRAAILGARDAGKDIELFGGAAAGQWREAFPHATGIFGAIVSGGAWEMPELPACAPCRMTVAALLCALAVDSGRHAGLSRELIAHHCRQAAEQVAVL